MIFLITSYAYQQQYLGTKDGFIFQSNIIEYLEALNIDSSGATAPTGQEKSKSAPALNLFAAIAALSVIKTSKIMKEIRKPNGFIFFRAI